MIMNPSVSGGGGGGKVFIDFDTPYTFSGTYDYDDDDAIVLVKTSYKGYGYVQYNLVTMTYICRDNTSYRQDDNDDLSVMEIPESLTLTFDGAMEISSINTATKTITGDSITVYKKA